LAVNVFIFFAVEKKIIHFKSNQIQIKSLIIIYLSL